MELFEKDKDITCLTTFRLPVEAALFAEYDSVKSLQKICRSEEYRENIVLHIGGGSNLMFESRFDGLVLHSAIRGITTYRKNDDTAYVIAGAGEKWEDLVDYCVDNDLAGLENMAGIPGEVRLRCRMWVHTVSRQATESGMWNVSTERHSKSSR